MRIHLSDPSESVQVVLDGRVITITSAGVIGDAETTPSSLLSASGVDIRATTRADIPAILDLVRGVPSFTVNSGLDDNARYTEDELTNWIALSRQNVLYSAFMDNFFVGFAFAHLMSAEWAVLEALYVDPAYRGLKLASRLFQKVAAKLRGWKVTYMSINIDYEDEAFAAILKHWGFVSDKAYWWYGIDL